MKPMNIELEIEELVLHGFSPGDRYRIGEAIERELRRLLTEQGPPAVFSAAADLAWIDAGTFNLKPSANSGMIGSQVAQAIYGGLNK